MWMLTPQNKKFQIFRKSEAKKASNQPWSFEMYSENWSRVVIAVKKTILRVRVSIYKMIIDNPKVS